MFDHIFYWLGGKACSALGIVAELVLADSVCTRRQTWNLGAVLFATALLFLTYSVVRRRR